MSVVLAKCLQFFCGYIILFDSMKNRSIEYYSLPLTQKEFEELSRDEILKKRIEYLKENNLL